MPTTRNSEPETVLEQNRQFDIYIVDDDELVTTERVAIVAFALADGNKLSIREVAGLVGVTRQSAWAILVKISRVAPITNANGLWYRVRAGD